MKLPPLLKQGSPSVNDKSFYQAMIAGTHSGVGKTTWALALMALAKRKGLGVQPFKAGPDYIDPSFHHQICHPRKSRNLDLFLLSEEEVKKSFKRNSADADIAITEGVMGLFDGKDPNTEQGSSAQLAKLLKLPVFLVVDGSGLATSAAAIVLGFQKFDPALALAGVFVNGVNSEGHFAWLKKSIEERTKIPCLGYLPRDSSFEIPERHLGLVTAIETREGLEKIQKAADLLETRFDWNRFLVLSKREHDSMYELNKVQSQEMPQTPASFRIGVAYDKAFSFYYEDNFDLLKNAGAELIFFSPLEDDRLPKGIDLLYFGGGFPEIYAAKLSENQRMIEAVRAFYHSGGFIYAECGGFIYLPETFIDPAGNSYPLVGLIPGMIRMTNQLQHFGYHELETLADTFLFPRGKLLRSHEFHYSTWDYSGTFQAAYRIGDRPEGFVADRLLASYQHLHFGTDPELVKTLTAHFEKLKRREGMIHG